MSAPASIKMYFNSRKAWFQREPIDDENSWEITFGWNFKWSFVDMDSERRIELDPESAREVEAFYQSIRRYLSEQMNPEGDEGHEPILPPKEVKTHTGFYEKKKYQLTYSNLVASRTSLNPVTGQRHVEIYQQNALTGFMRVLHRTPVDSIAKPYSGLHVDSTLKKTFNETKTQVTLRIRVAAGKTFFGYEYKRAQYIFVFQLPGEEKLAELIEAFYEDEEMFRVEIARDKASEIIPRANRKAQIVLKDCLFEHGLKESHVSREVGNGHLPEMDVPRQYNGEQEIEGEPNILEIVNEIKENHEDISVVETRSKFDLYSCVDRVIRSRDDQDYVSVLYRLNAEEEALQEYASHHVGEPDAASKIQHQQEVQEYAFQILEAKDDLTYMVFDDETGENELRKWVHPTNVLCRDIMYNKAVNMAHMGVRKIVLISIRVGREECLDYGEEGKDADEENEHVGPYSEFVCYLGFEGKLMMITRETVQDVVCGRVCGEEGGHFS